MIYSLPLNRLEEPMQEPVKPSENSYAAWEFNLYYGDLAAYNYALAAYNNRRVIKCSPETPELWKHLDGEDIPEGDYKTAWTCSCIMYNINDEGEGLSCGECKKPFRLLAYPVTVKEAGVTHELKTWPGYFQAIKSGEKKFELRKNDRNYKVGDTLLLREWNPGDFGAIKGSYTGDELKVKVTYILKNEPRFGLSGDNCIMSIDLISPAPAAGQETGVEDEIEQLKNEKIFLCDRVNHLQHLLSKHPHPPAQSLEDNFYSYEETGGGKYWNDMSELERVKYESNKLMSTLLIRRNHIRHLQKTRDEQKQEIEMLRRENDEWEKAFKGMEKLVFEHKEGIKLLQQEISDKRTAIEVHISNIMGKAKEIVDLKSRLTLLQKKNEDLMVKLEREEEQHDLALAANQRVVDKLTRLQQQEGQLAQWVTEKGYWYNALTELWEWEGCLPGQELTTADLYAEFKKEGGEG